MKKNKIIKLALMVTKGVFIIMLLVFLTFISMVIHWHFDKSFYDQLYLVNGFQAGLNSMNLHLSDKDLTDIALSEISNGTMYWILIRNGIIIFLFLAILRQIIKILRSIKNLQTFYDRNIHAFKQIAKIGFILTVIAFFNFGTVDGETMWHFTLPFQPLLFAVSFLVLAEIFKEGKKLQQDSNSIV